MTKDGERVFDFLSEREAVHARHIIENVKEEDWARALLRRIEENGGLISANKSLLFELRFAFALRQAGAEPRYEIPGEGETTLDFGFAAGDQQWAVELMRLEETNAAKAATGFKIIDRGRWFSRILSSMAADRRQSEEGETLKAVERICQKCEADGAPAKFPIPGDALHLLLIDFRTFLHGGDDYDKIHVGLGGEFLKSEFHKRYWDGKLISGVFSNDNPVRGAEFIRERVHFLGFVNEKKYTDEEFSNATVYIANPHLFNSVEQAQASLSAWPLKPATLLNR